MIHSAIVISLGLAVTQVLGWATTYSMLAVLAEPWARSAGVPVSVAFGGSSVFLVTLAIASRAIGRFCRSVGPAAVLTSGSCIAVVALLLLSQAQSVVPFFLVWGLLGLSGAAALANACNAFLVELFGAHAERPIAGVMLASGLSSTLALPMTHELLTIYGWQTTLIAFSGLQLGICLPIHAAMWRWSRAQSVGARNISASAPSPEEPARAGNSRMFYLMVTTICLSGLVSWGLSVVIIELLRALDVPHQEAVWLASSMGILQVSARLLEFLLPRTVLTTAKTVALLGTVLLSLVMLTIWPTAWPALLIFIVLYSAANGLLAVMRVILPLQLFEPRFFAAMSARVSLPMYLCFAAGGPLFGRILELRGATTVLAAATLMIALALGAAWLMHLAAMRHQR